MLSSSEDDSSIFCRTVVCFNLFFFCDVTVTARLRFGALDVVLFGLVVVSAGDFVASLLLEDGFLFDGKMLGPVLLGLPRLRAGD